MLQGKTIAFLVAPEGVEQVELTEPWKAIKQAGGTPRLVSTKSGQIQAFNHLDKADTFAVDGTVEDLSADGFDGLVLPGGVANPDLLRMDPKAVAFVRDFFQQGKPVAAKAFKDKLHQRTRCALEFLINRFCHNGSEGQRGRRGGLPKGY